MSDPLSISASVAGLAMLAESVIKQTVSIIQTCREASSQLQELRYSVAIFYGYLGSLRLMLDNQHEEPAPASIFACNRTLDKIKSILDEFDTDSEGVPSTSSALPEKHGRWRDAKQKAQWVFKKDKVESILAELEKHKSVLSLALSKKSFSSIIEVLRKQDEALGQMNEIRKQQSQIRQQQIQDSERQLSRERREMLSAVSQTRPEGCFKKHFSLHQDGTGVWLLESPDFERFMSTPKSKIWLYGIPGAGKSVLSATMINHIRAQRTEHVALAFFFCEYFNTATQTCRNIFGSIAKQLALQNPRALETLEEFFNDQTDLGHLDFNPEDCEFIDLIEKMSTNFNSTIIVIDGIDECQENRAAVVESLAQLNRDGIGSIKTIFASRKEPDIEERLNSFTSLPIAASKADVRLYVAAQLESRFRRMCEKDPALSDQILTVLVDKSEGMFQWVRCQIDCLENLASNKQRRKALEDLPRDLHGTYERILLRAIKSSEHATIAFVERTLRWIALATEPLSVSQIAHAISVEVEERSFDDSLDMRTILALCSSLVREVDGTLVFSHFSVKEYLMQISPEQGQIARFRISDSDHSLLAQTCLAYLLLDDFNKQGWVSRADLRPADDERNDCDWIIDPYSRYPFYPYASFKWIHHAKSCSRDDAISTLEQDLFNPMKTGQFLFWAHLSLVDILRFTTNMINLSSQMYDVTPLHLACIFGLTHLVDMLLCNGAKADVTSEVLGSPLRCAVDKRYFDQHWIPSDEDRYKTVRRLLSEPISKDQSQDDPLADALGWGDEEMASILLEHGFILTRSAVAKWKSKAAPEFLLRADLKDLTVDVEVSLRMKFGDLDFLRSSRSAQDGAHRTGPLPFHFIKNYKETIREACAYGRFENVKNFVPCLKATLTGDGLPNFLSQCLVEAAAHGHSDVVQYLVEANADPAFRRRSDGRTALHEASKGCHADVVRKLLEMSDDKTAISEIQDNDGLTPWMCAIKAGSIETLELFLTGPLTVNLQKTASNGQTVAHLAARTCNEQMVSYLKERSLDFTCTDDFGAAPIHALLEPHCNSLFSINNFESFSQIFRSLQWSDMLSGQTQSGQTLVHLIPQLEPSAGCLLWQDIRDNQIFNDTRRRALTIRDSEGNTPMHVLVQRMALYLKNNVPEEEWFESFSEFIQLLSTESGGESEPLHMKNKSGRTPFMELIQFLKDIIVPPTKKRAFSYHILRISRSLRGVRQGSRFLDEADNDKCTALHYIAKCRTNFPFKEMTDFVLERPIDVTAKDYLGHSALTYAAWDDQENVEFMRLLIPRMSLPQLEEVYRDEKSILHYICERNKVGIQDLIKDYLLQQIAECEKKCSRGRIPLMYAPAIITDDAIASSLIHFSGKTMKICDNDGQDLMYWSCELGSIAMLSALLDAGANIDDPLGPGDETGASRDPPLLIAASSGQLDTVEFLLGKGADPFVKGEGCWQLHHCAFILNGNGLRTKLKNWTGFDYQAKAVRLDYFRGETTVYGAFEGCTPLHIAAAHGDEQGLQWLLDEGMVSDASAETQNGSSPLILAAFFGHPRMCKKLIELGNPISKANHDGCTALHLACQDGYLEICKLLIATDNSCVFQNLGKQTPLEIAAGNGNIKIVELLLENDAQVTVGAEISARKAGSHDIAELLRCKLSTGNETSTGNTIAELYSVRLKAACEDSSESTLMEVLQKDINPNIRLSYKYRTPLHFACREGWKEAVELLVEKNANIEALDEEGCSPLMVAVKLGNLECAELLSQKGAQITTRDKCGYTTLHWAAGQNHFAILSYLLEEGIKANVQTYHGYTPLHLVSDPECVDRLLEHGADPFIVGPADQTVAWRFCPFKDAAELLKRTFANRPTEKVKQSIETLDPWGKSTPLYLAAFLGNSNAVSTLIEYGANVNGRCGPLGAPLHAALRQGHVEIATILLEMGARPYRVVRDGEENAGWFWEYGYEFCLQGQNGVWVSRSL